MVTKRILLAVFALSVSPAETRRGITPEDYYRFEFLTDPHLSPDGKLVAYVVTTVDDKQARRVSTIWMTATDGSRQPWAFTTAASSTHPRWRPDGRVLAFLSARDGGATQVHLLRLDGGEAERVTDLKSGVTAFAWSPDGKRLVCVSRSGPEKPRSDSKHYLFSNYKFNGPGYFDERRAHLFTVDVATHMAHQITSGDQRNDSDPVWSPDGSRIAFVAQRTDQERAGSAGIFTVSADGGELTTVADQLTTARLPCWSPDGSRLAYVAAATDAETAKIRLFPAAKIDVDLSPSEIAWNPDGKSLFFGASHHGEDHIFHLDLSSGKAAPTTSGSRSVHGFDRNERANRMVYTANDIQHLDDLYVSDLAGGHEHGLTNLNSRLWQQLELSGVERITYQSVDGWPVDGFFLKPIGWKQGQTYPMILSIHGGPASMYGVNWFHEFQVYTAHGWAVFFTNPRGSSGYGEKFERGVALEWGGKAYEDIMNGVDAILARHAWIDKSRLGVTGGSYGGYMTNWIVTHTNRFKAAVTLRSISNFLSVDGTRDGAYGHAKDFGGDLFENTDLYWKYSPVRYASQVKTPTLILHSDNDQRVPLEQGEQWFRALTHFGVTTEFVIFPGGDHDLTRTGAPRQLVESLNWQVYWFERFLNGNSKAQHP